ncbi:hypothetical protein PF049_14255 (plasmid) [Erythrobacteraceae bacterium WH01K]|nr:hypothetical protein PF049_14255 [Erythrobacteraceae bacterium WH01K]
MFRRIHVTRKKAKDAIAPKAWDSIPGHTRHYQERLVGQAATPAITVYTVGHNPLTTQGVNAIYKRLVERAWADGLIEIQKDDIVKALKAISSHSLRVGLTHDLIALGARRGGDHQCHALDISRNHLTLREEAAGEVERNGPLSERRAKIEQG